MLVLMLVSFIIRITNKDPTIWGAISGSPIFGNFHVALTTLGSE